MSVYVLLAEGFEEIEALSPVDYLRRVGLDVKTLSCSDSLTVKGSHGIPVVADMMVKEASGQVVEAVIIPGGMPGAANVGKSSAAKELIAEVAGEGKLVAAICAAPVVTLASTGLLKGKKFTCYPSMEEQLEQWGGSNWKELTEGYQYTGNRVEVDGNLITGAGPGAAEEFSLTLAKILAGEDAAKKLASSALFRN